MSKLKNLLVAGMIALGLFSQNVLAQKFTKEKLEEKIEYTVSLAEDRNQESCQGVTSEYVRSLFEITDGNGNHIMTDISCCSGEICQAEVNGITPEYVRPFVEITDKEGNAIFKGEDMLDFKREGVTSEDANTLVNIADQTGISFSAHQITWIKRHSNMGNISELADMKDEKGNPLFTGGEITNMCTRKASDVYELVNKLNENGKKLFDKNMVYTLCKRKQPMQFIRTLASIKDKNGNLVFDGRDIVGYSDGIYAISPFSERKIKYARDIANIVDENGNPLFKGKDIVNFRWSGMKTKHLSDFMNLKAKRKDLRIDGTTIDEYKQIAVQISDLTEFKDTEKPNAVVVLPYSDEYMGFQLFYNDETKKMLDKVRKSYDIWIEIVATEQEAYRAINRVQNIELLVLGGHGNFDNLYFGPHKYGYYEDKISGEKIFGAMTIDEVYGLDRSDKDLRENLKNLTPDATILLPSCLTGQGREKMKNLANFIAKASKGKRVIAPTEFIYPKHLVIESAYPLEVKFVKEKDGVKRDVTYEKAN